MKKLTAAIVMLPSVAFAQQTVVPESFGNYINSLPSASSVGTSDQFYVRQGGASKQVPLSALSVPVGADPTGSIDSTSAINNALLIANGRCVYLPGGTYATSAQVTLSLNNSCLVGDGAAVGTVSISQTVIKINSTTADAVHVNANLSNIRIANLTIDRTGIPVSGAGLFVDNGSLTTVQNVTAQDHFNGFSLGATSYSACTGCTAQNNYNHGFNLFNSASIGAVQWYFDRPLSQFNNGWGYFLQAISISGGLTFGNWNGPISFANTLGGIGIIGAASTPINDLFINNPVLSSDGNDEIQLTLFGGTNIKIVSPFVEQAGLFATGRGSTTAASNVGHGIAFLGTTATAGTVLVTSGIAYDNSQEGLIDNTQLQELAITGFASLSNSVKVAGAGININNANTVSTVTGSRSYNINFTSQTYGLLAANGGGTIISGNAFGGNVTGSCHATTNNFIAAANSDQDGTCGGFVSLSGGIFQTYVQVPAVAIASLPVCGGGLAGARATINNGVASPTYGSAVNTTGAATWGVLCNGTNWIYD